MVRVLFALVLVLGMALTGCSQSTPDTSDIGNVDISQDGEEFTITGEGGEELKVSEDLPEELKNFPAPEGFASQGGGTLRSGGGEMSAISWKGKGTVPEIAEFYETAMTDDGWTKEGLSLDNEGTSMRSFVKGDFNVTVTIVPDEENADDIIISVLGGRDEPSDEDEE
jgi:hypothetical protein